MIASYSAVAWRVPATTVATPRSGGWLRWARSTKRTGLPGIQISMRMVSSLHGALYRASSGRLGRRLRGGPVLLLTTRGRKSQKSWTRPLSYLEAGDDLVVVASAAGSERHPGWYLNLKANPQVSVQQGGRTRTMVARTVEGFDRMQLWDRLVEQYPVLSTYQDRATRQFPVVVLQPAVAGGGMSRLAAMF